MAGFYLFILLILSPMYLGGLAMIIFHEGESDIFNQAAKILLGANVGLGAAFLLESDPSMMFYALSIMWTTWGLLVLDVAIAATFKKRAVISNPQDETKVR